MTLAWMFHQEPDLHGVFMKSLTTREELDLNDFEWADQDAQESTGCGVYMLFCLGLVRTFHLWRGSFD